jgi:hypothetical protein
VKFYEIKEIQGCTMKFYCSQGRKTSRQIVDIYLGCKYNAYLSKKQKKFILGLTWSLYNVCIPGKDNGEWNEDGEDGEGLK